jgi:diacylglycerol kinase
VAPQRRTWLGKFADAFRGLFLAVRTESSFAAHLPVAVAAVALAALLRVSLVEWGLVALAIGGVVAAEVFNTAVESLARALDRGPDSRIRDALDAASGAVLVTVLTAIAVGFVVFVPRLVPLFW